MSLPAVIRPAVATTVEQLVRDRINACAQQHVFLPQVGQPGSRIHNCPLYYTSSRLFTTDPTWTIDTYPQLHLEPHDDGSIAATTTAPGTATVRYSWTTRIVEPRGWTETTDRVDITMTGQVTEANGQLEWQPA